MTDKIVEGLVNTLVMWDSYARPEMPRWERASVQLSNRFIPNPVITRSAKAEAVLALDSARSLINANPGVDVTAYL